jgi:hypothetical protein
VRTKATEYPPGALSKGLRVNTDIFLNETLLSKSVSRRDSGKHDFEVPFGFCMADFEKLSDGALGGRITTLLPPSSNGISKNNLWSVNGDESFHINYTVTATVSLDKRKIASATREFRFIPFFDPQPPLSACDFPNEYQYTAAREARSLAPLGRYECTNIEVQSEEPEALAIRTIDDQGSTLVNLMFKLDGRDAAALPKKCKIDTHLQSNTFITPYWHGKWVPTLEDVRRSPSADLQVYSSHEQSYTMDIQFWEPFDQREDSSTFIATLPVRVFVARTQLPCPTFFTPLVSRRYALGVVVSFPDIKRSELRLSLPLQVVYTDRSTEGLQPVSEPPQYFPRDPQDP